MYYKFLLLVNQTSFCITVILFFLLLMHVFKYKKCTVERLKTITENLASWRLFSDFDCTHEWDKRTNMQRHTGKARSPEEERFLVTLLHPLINNRRFINLQCSESN